MLKKEYNFFALVFSHCASVLHFYLNIINDQTAWLANENTVLYALKWKKELLSITNAFHVL